MTYEDLREIFISYVENKYSKNKSKMMLISESYFEDFCDRYENSENFRGDISNFVRVCKIRRLKENVKKQSFDF